MNRRKFIIGAGTILSTACLGAIYWPERWKYIVIHHSGGNYGNLSFLQKVHRERQANDPIDAIPYHFIIGNGQGLKDGEIASDSRKKYNIWGAHVSGKNIDRNARGIGICLIGNLEENQLSGKQYKTLVKLTTELMAEYNIPAKNVTGHGNTPGESTKCPGKMFPMEKFLQEIA